MKKVTSKKPVWSPDDLQKYDPLRKQSALSSFKVDKHWQQALAILTNGSEMGDSELSEFTYPMTSLEVSRRTQVVSETPHRMSIPRRRLSGGTDGRRQDGHPGEIRSPADRGDHQDTRSTLSTSRGHIT